MSNAIGPKELALASLALGMRPEELEAAIRRRAAATTTSAPLGRLLRQREVARILGVCPETIATWRRTGRIAFVRPCGKSRGACLIAEAEVQRLLAQATTPTPVQA
jgi:hypothetical protein